MNCIVAFAVGRRQGAVGGREEPKRFGSYRAFYCLATLRYSESCALADRKVPVSTIAVSAATAKLTPAGAISIGGTVVGSKTLALSSSFNVSGLVLPFSSCQHYLYLLRADLNSS